MATVKFYLERPYVPGTKGQKLRSSKCSIYLMFTISKEKRFPMRIDEKIEPKFWDFKDQKVRGTYTRHLEINLYLKNIETDIQNQYYRNRELPLDRFRELVSRKPTQEKKTIFQAFDKFLQVWRDSKDHKTVQKYETLLIRLTAFDKVYPIDLPTLDFNFYDAYKKFLYKIPNPLYSNHKLIEGKDDAWDVVKGDQGEAVGIFDETVNAYLIQLKTFLRWAEKRDFQVHQSYKSWEIIRRVHDPITLTSEELGKLENAVFNSDSINIGRDYLVFECQTGQRISDIKRFDLKDLTGDRWTFTPRKGNRLSPKQNTVHLNERALSILQKYNWKMPVLSEQKINKNIHKACKEAGIDKWVTIYRWAGNRRIKIEGPKHEFITSHSGRKTFITLALQSGMGADYVMEFTGISDYKTLKHYKGKFEEEAVKKELEKIPIMRKAL